MPYPTAPHSGASAVAVSGDGADPDLVVRVLSNRPALVVLIDEAAPFAAGRAPLPIHCPGRFSRLGALAPGAVRARRHRFNAREAVRFDHTVLRVERGVVVRATATVVRAAGIVVGQEAVDGGLVDPDALVVDAWWSDIGMVMVVMVSVIVISGDGGGVGGVGGGVGVDLRA